MFYRKPECLKHSRVFRIKLTSPGLVFRRRKRKVSRFSSYDQRSSNDVVILLSCIILVHGNLSFLSLATVHVYPLLNVWGTTWMHELRTFFLRHREI